MQIRKLFVVCFPLMLPGALITNPRPGGGSGTVAGVVSTPAPDNGNPAGQSPNTLSLTESITGFTSVHSAFIARVDLPQTGGRTEYFVTKDVTNLTSFMWTNFAVGVGCDPAGMVRCVPSDILAVDYDAAPAISGTGTTSATLSSSTPVSFRFDGLSVAPGASFRLTFSLGTCNNCSGTWGIAQQATPTPEPDTLLLAALGLLLAIAPRWVHTKKHPAPGSLPGPV